MVEGKVEERPEVLIGFTVKIKTGYGNLYITINEDGDGKPKEIFAILGKSGQSTQAKTEAIGRLVSLCLRSGVAVERIIQQLRDIAGENPLAVGMDDVVKSIPDAIARTLLAYYPFDPSMGGTGVELATRMVKVKSEKLVWIGINPHELGRE